MCTDTAPALFRDFSQSVARSRRSSITELGEHVIFTLIPRQLVFVFAAGEPPRQLLGEEALLFQGFPVASVSDLVAKTPNHLMVDLAGNMMAAPMLLLLLMTSMASVEWCGTSDDVHHVPNDDSDDASDMRVALHSFNLLCRGRGDDGMAPCDMAGTADPPPHAPKKRIKITET